MTLGGHLEGFLPMQWLIGVFSDPLDFRKCLYFAFTLSGNWAGDRMTDSNAFPAKSEVRLNLIFLEVTCFFFW